MWEKPSHPHDCDTLWKACQDARWFKRCRRWFGTSFLTEAERKSLEAAEDRAERILNDAGLSSDNLEPWEEDDIEECQGR